jgi:hypothetical protein
MQRSTLIFIALIAGGVHVHAQGLLETIITPEKAVPVVNQTLEGTWLFAEASGRTCRAVSGFQTDHFSQGRLCG